MPGHLKLVLVKLLHTAIWLFYNLVIFYLLYAAFTGNIDIRVWLCIAMVLLEGAILVVFHWACPLTAIARRYTTANLANFDIYIPEWVARHNKQIYTSLFVSALLIMVLRYALG